MSHDIEKYMMMHVYTKKTKLDRFHVHKKTITWVGVFKIFIIFGTITYYLNDDKTLSQILPLFADFLLLDKVSWKKINYKFSMKKKLRFEI